MPVTQSSDRHNQLTGQPVILAPPLQKSKIQFLFIYLLFVQLGPEGENPAPAREIGSEKEIKWDPLSR